MRVAPDDATREFHEAFKLPVHFNARKLEGQELEFRKTLIQEEYTELMEALDGDDLAHQFKEAADLIYVLFGWDQHAGNRLMNVFAEVHKSNMSKLWNCENCDGAGDFIGVRNDYDGGVPHAVRKQCPDCVGTGKVVKYREDGKVLKPPTYVSPDLSHLVA